jgi:hypothetical protein
MKCAVIRNLVVAGFACLVVGCFGGEDQWKQAADNVKRADEFREKKMKGIAEDKSLNESAVYKKYLDSTPEVQTTLPKEVAPWWREEPFEGGHQIIIRDLLLKQFEGSNAEERHQSERLFVRNRMLMCERMLRHLKDRNLKQVKFSVFTKSGGQDNYQELFRAVMTQADLPKLANPPVKAEAGGIFDPRGQKIGTAWKVELNRYPELEYAKQTPPAK